MSTLANFVGIPYVARGRTLEGLDCWGVCLLAARELYGIELPEYFYSSKEGEMLTHAFEHISRETQAPHWGNISDVKPLPVGSVHIFRIRGFETHCGLCVGGGEFLHSLSGRDSCVETLRHWSHRLTGTYSWLTTGS